MGSTGDDMSATNQAGKAKKLDRNTVIILGLAAALLAASGLLWAFAGGGIDRVWGPGLGRDTETPGVATDTAGLPGSDDTTLLPAVDDTDTVQPGGDSTGTPSGDGSTPPGSDPGKNAVSFIEIPQFTSPQTYEVVVEVLGWKDATAGSIYIRVMSARLLGPIDPVTGREVAAPPIGEPEYSSRIEGLTLLASTSERVRGPLDGSGVTTVQLVLVPSTGGAVPRIDRMS